MLKLEKGLGRRLKLTLTETNKTITQTKLLRASLKYEFILRLQKKYHQI